MTERQSDAMDVVEILRSRLGNTYHASIDGGRDEIVRVIADELHVGRDEAGEILRRQLDAGRIRYVTADEADPVEDRAAQHDERADRDNPRGAGYADRDDSLRINAIPGQGGPSAATSGQMGGIAVPPAVGLGAAAPVAGAGTGSAASAPLAVAAAGSETAGRGAGYWDFCGDKAGVVPSPNRKGQVEPKGT